MLTCLFIAGNLWVTTPEGISINMNQVLWIDQVEDKSTINTSTSHPLWLKNQPDLIGAIEPCAHQAELELMDEAMQ